MQTNRSKAVKFLGFPRCRSSYHLADFGKRSGVNIVASDTVKGTMTLSLKDVPWDQALDLVMQARNLDMRRQGNIINIAPRDELLAKDKAFLQAEKEIAELGPLYSQTFQLKYKNVEEFRKILRLEEYDSNNSNTPQYSVEQPRQCLNRSGHQYADRDRQPRCD